MPANDYVRARIDPTIKREAAAVLAGMGLTVSDACRMMLTKIAREKCLPFWKPLKGAKDFIMRRMRQTFSGNWGYKCLSLSTPHISKEM